jgi:MYXO-CTERM domain-containing protein
MGGPNSYWQDADDGTVSGISGKVDTDVFNGDLAALQSFAGAEADWGAQYVSQSWALATTTIQLTVNQALPASITLKNIGTKSWDTKTRLGTTEPHDRVSPFAGADWVATDRPAAVTGTVAPGKEFKFDFTFYAPNKPGAYTEYYGVVEEGVSWFSAAGQGGPADNDIEAKFQVNEAKYHGEFVKQSYPTLAQAPIMMTTGETLDGYVELKNVGTATWKAGVTKLAPTPRDKASKLAGSKWLSPTRVSSPTADVAPGDSFQFPLELLAGAPGDYTQTFSLVEEAVTWFADAPQGGGPPDNGIAVHVVVTAATTTSSSSGGGGSSAGGAVGAGGETGAGGEIGTGGESAAGGSHPHAGDAGTAGTDDTHGSCSCRAAGQPGRGPGSTGAALLAAAGALVIARKRRRG